MRLLNKNSLINLALFITSVLIVTLFLEFLLRGLDYAKIEDIYSMQSTFWEYDKLLGWRNKKNSQARYIGPKPFPIEFSNEISINSLGLRGDEIQQLSNDGYRVLFLGDSQVAAFEVAYENTFAKLLENLLPSKLERPVQVINAGVRGYGTDQSFLYYASKGHKLKPHLVVMFHTNNDPEDNTTLHRMKRPFGKSAVRFEEGGEYEVIHTPVPQYELCSAYVLNEQYAVIRVDSNWNRFFCRLRTTLLEHSVLFSFVSLSIQKSGLALWLNSLTRPSGESLRRATESLTFRQKHTGRIIRAMADMAAQNNSKFLFVVKKQDLPQIDNRLTSDVDTFVRENPTRDMHWKNDFHHNDYGHQVVADSLLQPVAEILKTLE
ncbi:MAG TPA: SGNH/GDSL hydrolase family protein [Gammaproteobacteria bacterium]|jgi:hypothetical protein|nr:hypothetical protein [Chromatiales bacterium]HJP39003.1 SGNH/GDSL hydrolase family protein [Gammaproteobacteria bacterium]